MREIHDIVTSLTDDDGSCRDANFACPTWNGVKALISGLADCYASSEVTDHEGRSLEAGNTDTFVASAKAGYVHVSYEGGRGLIKRLQAFISSEKSGEPFVELTFFP